MMHFMFAKMLLPASCAYFKIKKKTNLKYKVMIFFCFIFQLLLCGMRKYSVTDLKNNYIVTGSSSSFKRVGIV